jgi:hypothetical protein
MTTTVQKPPALVGESTDLFITLLREYRAAKPGTLAASLCADTLAYFASGGFEGNPGAELAEAHEWLRRAAAGDAEAKALIDALPPWHERESDYIEALNFHADYLRTLSLYAEGCEPGPVRGRSGKRAKGPTESQADELERIEEHADRLPKAWAPRVKEGSATALAWECLCGLHAQAKAPVPEAKWKEAYMSDYLPAACANPEAAFRDAKRNLKEQKAIRESAEGWAPKLTA